MLFFCKYTPIPPPKRCDNANHPLKKSPKTPKVRHLKKSPKKSEFPTKGLTPTLIHQSNLKTIISIPKNIIPIQKFIIPIHCRDAL